MSLRSMLTLSLLAGSLFAGHVRAQDVSPSELDRISAERQEAIGPRDWGPPVAAAPEAPLMPLGGHVTCMSPRMEFEPVYAGPGADTKQVGVATPQIAVTSTTSGGWTRILRAYGKAAWIPTQDLQPWTSTTASAGTRCVVAGMRPSDGMILFSYPGA
ncbi:SH3 domain-containing protein [Acetobacter orientalis]|uniref:SH3 domain-containing protein n=1 Tax=Acetobacter orientalis TaxID=146474 RepID=A0A2Z5ZMJ7_9PROT|nr:hypothetical protein AcetOrient_orf00234p [Acetobacter orientalis]